MSTDEEWVTIEGKRLLVAEMSDDHIKNAKAFLERKIAKKAYRNGHACPVDISNGPCGECDAEDALHIRWEEWVHRFDVEARRRAADAARQAAVRP